MDPFRGLGLPRIPGLSELVDVLQKQTEALAQLPRTLTDLNAAVRELITATRVATETIASAQRTAERLEGLVEELEEPVRSLKPGLERVGRVLDDPASPIAGMPVLHVWEAEHVIVFKRSMAAGYAGVQNPLFFRENSRMLFGDARERVEDILRAL